MASWCEPEARRPLSVRSATFLKESVERNKAKLSQEQAYIKKLIERDSVLDFIASKDGFWYAYKSKNDQVIETAQPEDLVTFSYEISNLDQQVLYSKNTLGVITYKVDKEELFQGLRSAIKLMKPDETIFCYFPSELAYGYTGDQDKITSNQPIACEITLHSIKKETQKQ